MALVDGLSPLAGIGLAFLLAVALAEFAKFRSRADKGFNWVALSGALFLFAGATSVETSGFVAELLTAPVTKGIQNLLAALGWLTALIGTLFVAYQVLLEK